MDYLEHCKTSRGLSKNTMRGYTDMANNYIIPHLGDFLLVELTPIQLEEFFKLISGHEDIFYGTNTEVLLDK